jgi:hypothetical protein
MYWPDFIATNQSDHAENVLVLPATFSPLICFCFAEVLCLVSIFACSPALRASSSASEPTFASSKRPVLAAHSTKTLSLSKGTSAVRPARVLRLSRLVALHSCI